MNLQAVGDIATLQRKYRSEVERQFAEEIGLLVLSEHFGERYAWMAYECCKFTPPGYTPDFAFLLFDGRLGFVEVKNSKKQKGYAATRQKLKMAAHFYPFYIWLECVKDRGWELEVIRSET